MLSACGAQTTSDRDVSEVGANERRAPVHVSLARKESELSEPNTVNRIELRYRDASTPPRYHRSYTIVVTPEGVDASVDVYGKVIATARHALTNERWVQLTNDAGKLVPTVHHDSDGVTGGSSYVLGVVAGNSPREFSWRQDATPEAIGLTEFAREVERLVPNLAALLETPN